MRTVQRLDNLVVQLISVSATQAAPATVSDGVAIAEWKHGPLMPAEVEIEFVAAGADTLANVELYEWNGTVWISLGKLNGGANVVLTAAVGAKFVVTTITGSRLAIAATLTGSSLWTCRAYPRECQDH